MLSSSVYATPIDIDLRPGFWERGILLVALTAALLALGRAQLPIWAMLLAVLLVVLIAAREWRHAIARPTKIRLYADGNIEFSKRGELSPQAANLLQSSRFLGLVQLHFEGSGGDKHACMVFPDRINSELQHRLRLWLAVHRPSPALFVGAA